MLRDARDLIATTLGCIAGVAAPLMYFVPEHETLILTLAGVLLLGLIGVATLLRRRESKRISTAKNRLRSQWEAEMHADLDRPVAVLQLCRWNRNPNRIELEVLLLTPSPKGMIVVSARRGPKGQALALYARLDLKASEPIYLPSVDGSASVKLPPLGEPVVLRFLLENAPRGPAGPRVAFAEVYLEIEGAPSPGLPTNGKLVVVD